MNRRPSSTQLLEQSIKGFLYFKSAEGLGFDLADALTRHAHLAPNLFQRVSLPIEQAIAQLQDAHFAKWQSVQDFAQILAQQIICRGFIGRGDFVIFDKVAEHRVFIIIGWRFQRERPARNLDYVLDFLGWHFQRFSHLLDGWFAA